MTKNDLSISAKLLYEEAARQGIKCKLFSEHLLLMSKGGKSWYTCGSRTSLQSSVGKTIADYKHLSKKIFLHHNIPTAKAVIINDRDNLKDVVRLNFPVVMKPSFGHQGKGVFVGLNSILEIKEKITTYHQVNQSYPVIIEEFLEGEKEFRIVCVDYKFVAAAYRHPAHVIGDGKSTISQLIDQKNRHHWRGEGHNTPLTTIKKNSLTQEIIQEQGLTIDSIPKKNQEILLRKTANLSTGGEARDVTEQVHSENIALFEKIARVTDLNTIGVDIKCDSLQTPVIQQKNTGVIEINVSPGLRMHHFPMSGKPINMAKIILDMISEKLINFVE